MKGNRFVRYVVKKRWRHPARLACTLLIAGILAVSGPVNLLADSAEDGYADEVLVIENAAEIGGELASSEDVAAETVDELTLSGDDTAEAVGELTLSGDDTAEAVGELTLSGDDTTEAGSELTLNEDDTAKAGEELSENGEEEDNSEGSFPKTYSSVEAGYITPVRNQEYFGSCCSFAVISAIEASVLRNNVLPGMTKDTLDLSERHLAYYSFYTPEDPLGYTDGDGVFYKDDYGPIDWGDWNWYLDRGSTDAEAQLRLGAYFGVVEESVAPYDELVEKYLEHYYGDGDFTAFLNETDLDNTCEMAREKDILHVKAVHKIRNDEPDKIKQAVLDYGAVTISFEFATEYMNFDNYAYCDPTYDCGANHSVTIVGWDDEYSRENFGNFDTWEASDVDWIGENCNEDSVVKGAGYRPDFDGAWLVKNSFGSEWGNDGYFWLSYEDYNTFYGGGVYAYEVEPADNDYHVYMHDGGIYSVPSAEYPGTSIANVYKVPESAQCPQVLKKIWFSLMNPEEYELQIYRNMTDKGDPTSGTPLLSEPVKGNAEESYYCFVDLPETIVLNPGDTYSIVLTFNDWIFTLTSSSIDIITGIRMVDAYEPGESFLYNVNEKSWEDLADREYRQGTFRLRGFTKDLPLTDIAEAEIDDLVEQAYTGEEIKPKLNIKYGGQLLREGLDYELSYSENVEIGEASITVNGIGWYTGETTVSFQIVKAPAPSDITPTVTEEPGEPSPTVTEEPGKPSPTVTEEPGKPSPTATKVPGKTTPTVTKAATNTSVPSSTRTVTSTTTGSTTKSTTTGTSPSSATKGSTVSGASRTNPATGDNSAPENTALLMIISLMVLIGCFRKTGKES